ncbi:MAG: AAA family ATPase [Methanobacteriota archaeon]|nr:MAG: AAA family ATPase [Euryarchaeota archaeon]
MPLSNKGWDETASCSTDLRRQRRCRPAPTDTRAQARGDARMVSDESDGKAGKSADEVRDEFEEKMDRLRRQYERDLHSFRYEIEEREYRLKAYEDKFNKIKQPPLLYAYVVRKEGPDLDGNQVVVARATELLKVSTGLMDKSQLGIGQYVWVHPQTYAIVEGSAVRNEGVIAKVADMMDGKLVISIEGDMEKRLIDTDKTVYKKLKPGFQISVLPPTMEVLEVLPNLEVKSLLLGEKPNVNYGQIGGLMEAIERIKDVVVLPYQEAKLFAQIALEAPRGILLYGPPGCGKTLLVKAIATENDMTFFNVSIADVLSKWVGESERIIKEIFRQAHEKKPSIVFFDEIEALFTVRGMMDTSGVHKNIIAQILSEMDGLVELHDVFVIGATNRADLVDPALLRPGRFDEIIEIPRPDRRAAEEILRIYLNKDLPVQASLEDQSGGHKEAVDALRRFVLDELYGENKWVKVKLDAEAKESIKTVKRKDIISGAIIEAIVTTAKKNFVKRVILLKKTERKKEGLTMKDLEMAIDEESKEHAITEMYVYEKRQREVFRTGADPMVG